MKNTNRTIIIATNFVLEHLKSSLTSYAGNQHIVNEITRNQRKAKKAIPSLWIFLIDNFR